MYVKVEIAPIRRRRRKELVARLLKMKIRPYIYIYPMTQVMGSH
jgi:hypothetical protein